MMTKESLEVYRCNGFSFQGEFPQLFYLVLLHLNDLPKVRHQPHPGHYTDTGKPVILLHFLLMLNTKQGNHSSIF